MIFRNSKGQVVGELTENGKVYHKVVDSRKHKMRMFDAYGIDEHVVDKLVGKCERIKLTEKDTGNIYETELATFLDKGIKKNFDGAQIFLPLRWWSLATMKTGSLF